MKGLYALLLAGIGLFINKKVNANVPKTTVANRIPKPQQTNAPQWNPEPVSPWKPEIVPITPAPEPTVTGWTIPPKGERFIEHFQDAEYMYQIPRGLLARIAQQESNFRDDIISGATKSSAGAVGLMQIVPRWHPGVDPTDPVDSIYYAAGYLRRLFNRFGSWKMALAAYNWGQGNLSTKGFENAPRETRNYVAQITKDVKVA